MTEVSMYIGSFIGYVAILIGLGFAAGAVFWAADKRGRLGIQGVAAGHYGQ